MARSKLLKLKPLAYFLIEVATTVSEIIWEVSIFSETAVVLQADCQMKKH